jgi:hypothetical protein
MFESIVIRHARHEHEGIDPGLLAETIFLRSNPHILVDKLLLDGLVKEIGVDSLLRLFRSKYAREAIAGMSRQFKAMAGCIHRRRLQLSAMTKKENSMLKMKLFGFWSVTTYGGRPQRSSPSSC